jgi:hypothetical protein
MYPSAPPWVTYLFAAISLANIGLTIALFVWKRAAFFAFWGVAMIVFGINLSIGISPVQSLTGFIGPVLLTCALQIGGARRGWLQLR